MDSQQLWSTRLLLLCAVDLFHIDESAEDLHSYIYDVLYAGVMLEDWFSCKFLEQVQLLDTWPCQSTFGQSLLLLVDDHAIHCRSPIVGFQDGGAVNPFWSW
eukprot:TRINITY_DN2040_c0_g2_i5.p11 TRINITY_DN2040_c0_g2~~TRINITY_DN2040_c0_g2_i5.p11  ORF type:complete len:102 (-),score=13.57 TRINITY_DN2040_c0_g2_i5:786-1091(-)